ncbi:MAG TPA: 1-phosphofructokinase [Clostridia bacterium]|nr:1-phosphofructokinase [Clostridia bacterium]
MIITVTCNPALDRSLSVPQFSADTVNRATGSRLDPGGKGVNVSKVLKALGTGSIATGFLGGSAGNAIANALDSLGIRHDFVRIAGETRTNLKIFDPVRMTYTDINEPGEPVSAEAVAALEEKLLSLAKPNDIVLFAGSVPKGLTEQTIAGWAEALTARGVLVAVDQDGLPLKAMLAAKPSWIKPNDKELKELLGLPDIEIATLASAARSLVCGGIAHVVVSLGERGALFADEQGILYAEGLRVNAVSTVGAGDALTAALLYAAEQNLPREETAKLAIATATAKVTCPGSSPPDIAMIRQYRDKVNITTLE